MRHYSRCDNLFNRWEAGQQLAERALLQAIRQGDAQATLKALSDALAATLPDARLDDGLRQQFLMLPEEKRLAEQLEPLDPSLLRARRLAALRTLVQPLVPYLQDMVARQH